MFCPHKLITSSENTTNRHKAVSLSHFPPFFILFFFFYVTFSLFLYSEQEGSGFDSSSVWRLHVGGRAH